MDFLIVDHMNVVKLRERQKGRAKGRLRKVTQRSFKDCRLSIIDIDFPEALHQISFRKSLNLQY